MPRVDRHLRDNWVKMYEIDCGSVGTFLYPITVCEDDIFNCVQTKSRDKEISFNTSH